jgi:hypothetical protein
MLSKEFIVENTHANSGLHGLDDRSQTFAGIMNIIKRA